MSYGTAGAAEYLEDGNRVATVNAGAEGGVAFNYGPAPVSNHADVHGHSVRKGNGLVLKNCLTKTVGIVQFGIG